MNLNFIDVNPETTIYVLFLLIGAFFLIYELKMLLRPHKRGYLVGVDRILPENCSTCKSTKGGKASIGISVQTDDGKKIKAEMSPCVMCLNKVKIGSRVGVTKVGSRIVCQRVIEPFGPPKNSTRPKIEEKGISNCCSTNSKKKLISTFFISLVFITLLLSLSSVRAEMHSGLVLEEDNQRRHHRCHLCRHDYITRLDFTQRRHLQRCVWLECQ